MSSTATHQLKTINSLLTCENQLRCGVIYYIALLKPTKNVFTITLIPGNPGKPSLANGPGGPSLPGRPNKKSRSILLPSLFDC